jgi:hypothetical protein
VNQQLIQTIGVVFGVLLAVPLLTALVYIAMFAASLKSGANTLKDRVDEFIRRIDENFASHDRRIIAAEARLNVLWDGHERRNQSWSGKERRSGEMLGEEPG